MERAHMRFHSYWATCLSLGALPRHESLATSVFYWLCVSIKFLPLTSCANVLSQEAHLLSIYCSPSYSGLSELPVHSETASQIESCAKVNRRAESPILVFWSEVLNPSKEKLHGHKHKAAHNVLIANDHRRLCIDFHKIFDSNILGKLGYLRKSIWYPFRVSLFCDDSFGTFSGKFVPQTKAQFSRFSNKIISKSNGAKKKSTFLFHDYITLTILICESSAPIVI